MAASSMTCSRPVQTGSAQSRRETRMNQPNGPRVRVYGEWMIKNDDRGDEAIECVALPAYLTGWRKGSAVPAFEREEVERLIEYFGELPESDPDYRTSINWSGEAEDL